MAIGSSWAGERGRPLVEVYNAQEVGGGHLNNSFIELPDGRLAVANAAGILMFDGARWRVFDHPDRLGGVRKLSLGPDGRIYAGFHGDMGWFVDEGTGNLVWHSLLPDIPAEARPFGAVLSADYDSKGRGVWFVTSNRLFFWSIDAAEMYFRDAQGVSAFGGFVGADYWYQDQIGGLQRVVGVAPIELAPVAGSAVLGEARYIRAVVAGEGEWKVAMADGRLYRYNGAQFLPWAEPLWARLAESHVFDLLSLPDGRWVIGAGEHGPWILDRNGVLLDRYDGDDGVPGHATRGLHVDRLGGLWLAQDLKTHVAAS